MPVELETPAQRWFELTNSFGRGFNRKEFDLSNTDPAAAGIVGAGVNMAIRRSALAHIGLFDEALDGGTATRSGGDHEFFYRTMARGYRIVYEPAALVWHRHRRDWDALRDTLYSYGVGLFAWWTHTLLVENELPSLAIGFSWFRRHHLRNLIRAFRSRGKHIPRDLAIAEFRGVLAGPVSLLKARKQRRAQGQYLEEDKIMTLNPESSLGLQPQPRVEG
jgi:GT2 family glycosyltransferase